MSTPRRRPTGGIRRPQVAGRPRNASASAADSEPPQDTTEGGLAVEERTEARSGSDDEGSDTDESATRPDGRRGAGRASRAQR